MEQFEKAKTRKDEHLKLALELKSNKSYFSDVRFVHNALPKDIKEVDISANWAGVEHDHPFYINAMTGGSKLAYSINKKLAQVAKETSTPIASGSMSIAVRSGGEDVLASYKVLREYNPDGFIMANLGAEYGLEEAKKAVSLIEADAMQIHLNIAQELVMAEGDRDFSTWKNNIKEIVNNLDKPVIVKEVGNGMSRDDIINLSNLGVRTVDISGRGGTNFIEIENKRSGNKNDLVLESWGQTTPEALLEAKFVDTNCTILASGGIRTYLDAAKAVAMGASAVGISGVLLEEIEANGVEGGIELIESFKEGFKLVMKLLSCQTIKDLQEVPLVYQGDLLNWYNNRKVNKDV